MANENIEAIIKKLNEQQKRFYGHYKENKGKIFKMNE